MELANKNVLMVGLGKTGIATAAFLQKRGARVTATDIAKEQDLGIDPGPLAEMGIQLEIGYHDLKSFEQAHLIVLSPGVSHTLEPIKKAVKNGSVVIGEIELASRFIKEPIIAVTGTNGKTTTTTLLGDILRHSGFNVFVGGNIGNPLIEYADGKHKADMIVAEISSFQLDTIETFRPKVGVLLNITEDHMDRYPDFNAYAVSKCRLFKNQKNGDTAVLNGADTAIFSLCKNIKSKKLVFCREDCLSFNRPEGWAAISKNDIRFNVNQKENLLDISNLKLHGIHNLENIAAAGLAAFAAGGNFEGIKTAVHAFKGLPHRLEYIRSINNVQFFNDSKATNIDAVEKALEAFSVPVILIMGGRNKDFDFRSLEKSVKTHVKKLIVMGEAGPEIASALEHIIPIKHSVSMDEAVSMAYQEASPGDVVLLSPACASFDMYSNYAERGDCFRKAVNRLTH